MGPFEAARVRALARTARPVTLSRRATAPAQATRADVLAFLRGYSATELQGGLQQGDATLETGRLPTPFTPPLKGDAVLIDGRTWSVLGAVPVNEGPTLIGYTVTIRGG